MTPASATPHQAECKFAERWLFESALPFWIAHGVDSNDLAYEELEFDGTPKDLGYRRSMVQFRQVYVFAQAAVMGHCPNKLPVSLFHRAAAASWHPEGGFVHKLDRHDSAAGSERETYDQAFGMLACAWTYAIDGEASTVDYAYRTLRFLDEHVSSEYGGYENAAAPRLPRGQNPHMHLLEAFLALYEVTRDELFLTRATTIVDLLERCFVTSVGALREHFDAEWRPAAGEVGEVVEPGHHYEWVWLLHEYARLSGSQIRPVASQLFDFATRHGLDDRGRPVEQVDTNGVQLRRSVKFWATTEQLKAHIVRAEARGQEFDPQIALIVRNMREDFLLSEPPVWFEELAADGTPSRRRMPASTLYHITLAVLELLRWQSGTRLGLAAAVSRKR